jgi:hypothetical protein
LYHCNGAATKTNNKMAQKITFVKESSEKMFINPFTGRGNSYKFYAINELGQKGCLPGENKAYSPIGGIKALKEVIEILIWI